MYRLTVESPVGPLHICSTTSDIRFLSFFPMSRGELISGSTPLPARKLLERAADQLEQYFGGTRTEFELPLLAEGTEFRERVWQALREIPYGEVESYGQLAQRIGKPKAARAVGQANHHNPISIVIPCHRVIGADGSLTGFGGGLTCKSTLLQHEQNFVSAASQSAEAAAC